MMNKINLLIGLSLATLLTAVPPAILAMCIPANKRDRLRLYAWASWCVRQVDRD